jgi:hypothetical protein
MIILQRDFQRLNLTRGQRRNSVERIVAQSVVRSLIHEFSDREFVSVVIIIRATIKTI